MIKYCFPETTKFLNGLIKKWQNILENEKLDQSNTDHYKAIIREGLELKPLYDNFETIYIDDDLSLVANNKSKKFYIVNVNSAVSIWQNYRMIKQMLSNYGYKNSNFQQLKESMEIFMKRSGDLQEMFNLIYERYPRRENELTFTMLDVNLNWRQQNENNISKKPD